MGSVNLAKIFTFQLWLWISGPGADKNTPAPSCRLLLTKFKSIPDGHYWIKGHKNQTLCKKSKVLIITLERVKQSTWLDTDGRSYTGETNSTLRIQIYLKETSSSRSFLIFTQYYRGQFHRILRNPYIGSGATIPNLWSQLLIILHLIT